MIYPSRTGACLRIPAAPWHRPKERYVGNGVYVTDIYGSHLIAALIHWLFVALRRRWKRPAQNQDRDREERDPASSPRFDTSLDPILPSDLASPAKRSD